MGLLFPWRSVLEGSVPSKDDFDLVRIRVMTTLNADEDVRAALVYGSVLRGDHNSRSDVDLIVICRNVAEMRVGNRISLLNEYALSKHVFLSPHIYRESLARTGQHTYGPSFQFTLRNILRKDCKKGFPHRWLWTHDHDIRREMSDKLEDNLRVVVDQKLLFSKMCNTTSEIESWLEFMYRKGKCPLHFFMRFARWMLWWQNQSLEDDSKEGVQTAFLTEPSFRLLRDDFRSILALDHDYDELLTHVLKKKSLRQQYLFEVKRIVESSYEITTNLFVRAQRIMRRASQRVLRAVA